MTDESFGGDIGVFSKVVRAGRRTYFFDVKKNESDELYLTVTESKKFVNEDESVYYKRHKIFIFKEYFADFRSAVEDCMQFILDEKGDAYLSRNRDTPKKPE